MRAAVLVAACLAAVALASARSEAFVPLFMWSGRPYFVNDHVAVSDAVSAPEFRQMFERIVSPQQEVASDLKYLNNPVYYASQHSAPELIVAFVYSHLSSAAASREAGAYDTSASSSAPNANFRFLRTALSEAASSFAAPSFIAPSAEPLSQELTALHGTLAPAAQVFATQIDGEGVDAVSSCDALLQHLDDHAYAYANKQSDLVLVKLGDGVHRHDNCMQRVTQHIAKHTKGDYLAILSADSAAAQPLQTAFVELGAGADSGLHSGMNFAAKAKFSTQALGGATNSTGVYPGVKMITPSVFWALIIALIMVVAISCGVCWVQSIETPARFTSTALALSKEY